MSLLHSEARGTWRKRLLLLAFAATALFAGAVIWARSDAAQVWARAAITDAMRTELGLEAELGGVGLEVSTLALVARDIRLSHPTHGELARANELRVQPWIGGLYRGEVKLKSITLDGARVSLVVRDGAIINLPELPASESHSTEIDLPFRTLTLENASVGVDAKPLFSGELHGINVTVDGSARNLVGVDLRMAGGHVDHSLGRETIDSLALSGHVKPHSFWVQELSLRSPFFNVDATDTNVELPFGRHYQGHVTVEADLDHLRQLPHGIDLPEMGGRVSFTGDVGDERGMPVGKGKATLTNVRVLEYGFGQLVEAEVNASPTRIDFKATAHIIGDGGRVALQGNIGLGDGLPMHVDANVHDVAFARLLEQLGVTPNAIVDWILAGTFSLRGTLDPLALSGPLRMPTRRFQITRDAWHRRPARHVFAIDSALVTGTVAIDPEGIHLQRMHGELPHSTVDADVLLGFSNMLRVRGSSTHVDLADCTPLLTFPLAGTAQFSAEVEGTYQDPQVKGRIGIDGFAFNTFSIGDVRSDFRLEKGGLAVRFPLLTAKKNQSTYSGEQLVLDFTQDRVLITTAMIAERLTLADFYHAFHFEADERFLPYQADLKGRADLRFTMGFPGDSEAGTLHSTIDLTMPNADLNGFAFTDGLFRGSWKWLDWRRGAEGGELSIEHFSLKKGRGTVNASGRMLQNGVLDVVMVADRIAFADTEGLRDRMPRLGGTYAATGTVKGNLEVPRADLDLVFTNMNYEGRALGDGRGYVRLTDRQDPWIAQATSWPADQLPDEPCAYARYGLARGSWQADPPLKTAEGLKPALIRPMAFVACGEAFDGRFTMDMAFGRTKVFPLRGLVTWNELDLAPWLPQETGEDPLVGASTGTLHLTGGDMMEPTTLAGRLTMPRLDVSRGPVFLRATAPVDVEFGDGRFGVTRADFAGPASTLRVNGGGSLAQGLALQIDGGVDLSLLSNLSTTISAARGDLHLRARIAGHLERPALFGSATIRGGSLRFATFPTPVEQIDGDITFSAQQVIVDRLHARVSGGDLAITGRAALDGNQLGNYLLKIDARRIALRQLEGVQAVLGARTELAWTRGERLPVLRGSVSIDRLRYTRPVQLGSTITDMYRSERADVQQYDPDGDRIALDLRVVHDQPLRIDNNLMDADVAIVDGERPFRIVGTDQRYGVLGTMRLRRGIVRFRDVAFDVREGEISFDDADRIFPRFDISAVTNIRRSGSLQQNWTISLRAVGNSESFAVRTRSDPHLAEEDIALLLAIGMTNAELSQLQAGGLTSADALNALASVSGVDQEVRRAVPSIDDLRVSNGYSRRSFRNEPQLFVGKRLADNLRLSATTGLSDSGDLSTSVQWQLSDETSVEATYNNQNASGVSQVGDVGADLRWRLEFE